MIFNHKPYIFVTQCQRLNNLGLKYQRFTPSVYKDIGIRKFEFETKAQFFCIYCKYSRNHGDLTNLSMYLSLRHLYMYLYINSRRACIYKYIHIYISSAKTAIRKHAFKSSAMNGRTKGGKKKKNCVRADGERRKKMNIWNY